VILILLSTSRRERNHEQNKPKDPTQSQPS